MRDVGGGSLLEEVADLLTFGVKDTKIPNLTNKTITKKETLKGAR